MKMVSAVLIYASIFMLVASMCILLRIVPSNGDNVEAMFVIGFLESCVLFILGGKAGRIYSQSKSN